MADIIIIPLLPYTSTLPIRKFFGPSRTKDWTDYWEHGSGFAAAGISSWEKWASKNEAQVEVVRSMPTPEECGYSGEQLEKLLNLAPPMQRWVFPSVFHKRHGRGTHIAMIDADTIISPETPSIFEQSQSDVVLTGDGYDWNPWKENSSRTFAPLFPDVEFAKELYCNTGVMVLNNNVLPGAFIEFVLSRFYDILDIMNGKIGTDEMMLNFIIQCLVKDKKLTTSYLGRRWNARMDLELKTRSPDPSKWEKLAPVVVSENYISHFVRTKNLMPSAWQSLEQ